MTPLFSQFWNNWNDEQWDKYKKICSEFFPKMEKAEGKEQSKLMSAWWKAVKSI